ncbi:MAG: type II/IV secretion system protein [Sulfurospirillum sp.]|nr:type II/IV secretion system protein [Sulfurospirillum sp.]MBL0703801.1 type II/IV secretion system protein [Sulfurospirillum sp.]
MLTTEPIHNLKLEAYEVEDISLELSLKNYLLFSTIDDEVCALMCERYLAQASNFYTKLKHKYPVYILNEDSYDRLYNSFLELRTDKAITTMEEDSSKEEDDEDISLTDFLRISSDILTSEESAPIIKFVNAMFYQAVKKRASDIHIEMQEKRGEVRFRIDGVISKNADLDKKVVSLIVSRIKVISNLDISEKRIPQDGRTQIKIAGETLDIRVSILPTFYGERVVMRLLMQSSQIPKMDELGFDNRLIVKIQKLLKVSHGIILVTGPTGSGKTTSLHSFLKEVQSREKNLITVEDPVEYKSDNIAQIQVNEKIGLTFAAALRSILRQDPDTIMIGEIRDEETASIAIRAALTGHLVFSTLHTNSAAATVLRLVDMGIEPFLISSSLLGILAQRLVRILCDDCKQEDKIDENLSKAYNIPIDAKIYKANECKICNYSGYVGRKSIGELLVMTDDVKNILKNTTDEHVIKIELEKSGFKTISSQLLQVLINGETSLNEAIRIGLEHVER